MRKGRLRPDDQAVRFVEVTVNGPKSWSLAAELHPDIAAAHDAAQDSAATQIIHWLGDHATTRVGPRGGQVQVPVEQLEAVTGAALHLPGGRSAPSSAPADQLQAVRRRAMARPAHGRRAGLPRRDQRHWARRRHHRPAVPGRSRSTRVHPRPRGRGRAACRVRRLVQRPSRADRRQHRPLRSRLACREPGSAIRTGVATMSTGSADSPDGCG